MPCGSERGSAPWQTRAGLRHYPHLPGDFWEQFPSTNMATEGILTEPLKETPPGRNPNYSYVRANKGGSKICPLTVQTTQNGTRGTTRHSMAQKGTHSTHGTDGTSETTGTKRYTTAQNGTNGTNGHKTSQNSTHVTNGTNDFVLFGGRYSTD